MSRPFQNLQLTTSLEAHCVQYAHEQEHNPDSFALNRDRRRPGDGFNNFSGFVNFLYLYLYIS